MIKSQRISLIIPCRNEEQALKKMLRSLPSSIDEVIVVDNGSTDNTQAVAKTFGAKLIIEKRQHRGIGYGYAHRAGFAAASGDIIVTMDGDNTYPIRDITKSVQHLIKNNLDFVSCNRFPLAEGREISWVRQLGVKVLNLETAILYNYRIQDILSGMWIFRKNNLSQIVISEGGWNLSPEIKLKAIMAKDIKFGEFHINHYFRFDGSSKQKIWQTGFDHLIYIAKLRSLTFLHNIISRFHLTIKRQIAKQNIFASE